MANIALKGNPVTTVGELPEVGQAIPEFTVTTTALTDVPTAEYKGSWTVLNIFPSVDTPTCATSARTFNERCAETAGVQVYNLSADLPFAMKRFCASEGLARVQNVSSFRSTAGDVLGVTMTDGPLAGLLARAIVVLDESNVVRHVELVPEIADEPNYDAALAVVTS